MQKTTRLTSLVSVENHSWDEWVPESRALKLNEANLAKQASLKDSYPGKKKAIPKTSGSLDSTDRGNKKSRTKDTSVDKEEDFTKRPEIKVPIPDSLKAQLVDDWENITKNQQVNYLSPVDERERERERKRTRLSTALSNCIVDLLIQFCHPSPLQLVPLPRTPNVVQILEMYKESKKDKKA